MPATSKLMVFIGHSNIFQIQNIHALFQSSFFFNLCFLRVLAYFFVKEKRESLHKKCIVSFKKRVIAHLRIIAGSSIYV